MAQFTVYFTQTMSTAITVEAEDYESAIDVAEESDQMPSASICAQCSGWGTSTAGVDTAGQWELESVDDVNGEQVWSERRP